MVKQSIVPAIIPLSYHQLEERLRELRGVVRSVQVDVMDATYTPSASWPYAGHDKGAVPASQEADTNLPYWAEFDLEVDLMVREPEAHLEHWALAGAKRIVVHAESTHNLAHVIAQCIERRLEVAVALKPQTSENVLEPIISRVVFVQCMGNERIGMQGVPLDPAVYDKIARIHARWPETLIGVDIGVSADTLPRLCEAGARRFAAGSAVFERGDPVRAIRALEEVADRSTRT